MKTSTKFLFFSLVLTSLGLSAGREKSAEQEEFAKIYDQEEKNPNFFARGWLVERTKRGDLEGIKKEIDFDTRAIESAEENLSKATNGETLLKIAAERRFRSPATEQIKFNKIIRLFLENKADLSQWGRTDKWHFDSADIQAAKRAQLKPFTYSSYNEPSKSYPKHLYREAR